MVDFDVRKFTVDMAMQLGGKHAREGELGDVLQLRKHLHIGNCIDTQYRGP